MSNSGSVESAEAEEEDEGRIETGFGEPKRGGEEAEPVGERFVGGR